MKTWDEPDKADIDALAASLRADATDVNTLLDVLATKLENCLPHLVHVESEGRQRARRRTTRLVVTLADQRFELRQSRHGLNAEIIHIVRGVRLSTTPVRVEEWITTMSLALANEAAKSEATRAALQSLLS